MSWQQESLQSHVLRHLHLDFLLETLLHSFSR